MILWWLEKLYTKYLRSKRYIYSGNSGLWRLQGHDHLHGFQFLGTAVTPGPKKSWWDLINPTMIWKMIKSHFHVSFLNPFRRKKIISSHLWIVFFPRYLLILALFCTPSPSLKPSPWNMATDHQPKLGHCTKECSQPPDSPRHHKGVSLGNLSALLVQVADHLAVHVRAQLGGVVDVGDHDGLGSDDQAQAQGLAKHQKETK